MRELALETAGAMDLVLHLHPASEAPAPPFERLAGLSEPLPLPVLTVYTKGDLISGVPARIALEARGSGRRRERAGWNRAAARAGPALLPEREFEYDPEDVGTQPLRFFVVEYLREAAFEPPGRRAALLLHRRGRGVSRSRAARIHSGHALRRAGVAEGDRHRPLGTDDQGAGAHARRRLEELIGAPVYLDCWVKALPNWRKSSAALARFGFPRRSPRSTSSKGVV